MCRHLKLGIAQTCSTRHLAGMVLQPGLQSGQRLHNPFCAERRTLRIFSSARTTYGALLPLRPIRFIAVTLATTDMLRRVCRTLLAHLRGFALDWRLSP